MNIETAATELHITVPVLQRLIAMGLVPANLSETVIKQSKQNSKVLAAVRRVKEDLARERGNAVKQAHAESQRHIPGRMPESNAAAIEAAENRGRLIAGLGQKQSEIRRLEAQVLAIRDELEAVTAEYEAERAKYEPVGVSNDE